MDYIEKFLRDESGQVVAEYAALTAISIWTIWNMERCVLWNMEQFNR
jgi:hypothetical protein